MMQRPSKTILTVITLTILLTPLLLFAKDQQPQDLTQDQRMAWWKDAKFGMFIHWGIYSVLGGEYNGKDYGKEAVGRSAEWIMFSAKIPKDEYAKLAGQFNPTQFDAKQWVTIAKNAGMKYLIITAKHHDGFSMYDSKATTYDIMDATPYKKDILKALADECAKQGIRFGIYYSHQKDWYNLGPDRTPPTEEYVKFVKDQITDLLTQYGPIAVAWFDMGTSKYIDINRQYKELVRILQPKTIISGRISGGSKKLGDYQSLGDRTLAKGKMNVDFETPMTLRDNWAYDRNEDHWKSLKDVLTILCLTTCRGGNVLLNVGPSPQGTLAPQEIERLTEVGKWLQVNGEAIYGTTAGPFNYDFPWGTVSAKPGKLYLFILKWDANGIKLNGIKSKIKKAYLLCNKNDALSINQDIDKGLLEIKVPQNAPDENISVIALETDGNLMIDETITGKYFWNPKYSLKVKEHKAQKEKKNKK